MLLAVVLACAASVGRAQPPAPSEPEVKAAMLLNFARYTDWPSAAFASATNSLVIGIVGKDPFGVILDKTCSGKSINGRSIVVKRLSADQNLTQCHLLFVPASEKRRQRDMLGKLRESPVLTVGEDDDFLDRGGAVQLLLKDGSVRFSVNLYAVKAARLRINSSVLQFADSVRGKHE
jgi:hypothetical protein